MPISGEILGQRIKSAREELGFSQEELAERIGLGSQSAMSRAERSGDLSSLQLAQLAELTGHGIDYFLREDLALSGSVSLRAGDAEMLAVKTGLETFDKLVADYEFLLEIEAE